MGQAPLTRRKPMGPKRPFKIAAFDTETRLLNGRLLIAQAYHEDWEKPVIYDGKNPTLDFLHHVFSLDVKLLKKTVWYSHNAEYDWRYLYDGLVSYLDQFDFELRERSEGKFYEVRVLSRTLKTKSGRPLLITRFRDSMAVFNNSLKALTDGFAPEYKKQDIGLGDGVVFDKLNSVHRAYAENDVVGLVRALQKYDEEMYRHYHVHLAGTFSGTAYQGWLRFAPEGEYHDRQPAAIEDFLRKCYYGGLVQLNAPADREIRSLITLDINSSYPAAMRLGVPRGKARFTREYRPGFPGFYKVLASVPDDYILPICPHLSEDGKLSWPAGGDPFVTYLTSIEIDHLEKRGVSFVIDHGYFFPAGLTFCFSEFIDVCEALRTQFKGTPTEIVVKFNQNSFYGRFGMKKDGREYRLSGDGAPEGFDALMGDKGRIVPNIYIKRTEREAEYMLPHYAAWITANARIMLDKATEAAGRENVRYRDTDSLKVEGALRPELAAMISARYGDLKNEGESQRVRIHCPKGYTYFDPKKQEWRAVYKGMTKKSMTPELILALHNGISLPMMFNSTTSLNRFIKTGRLETARTRSPTDPDHVYGHIRENNYWRPRRAAA